MISTADGLQCPLGHWLELPWQAGKTGAAQIADFDLSAMSEPAMNVIFGRLLYPCAAKVLIQTLSQAGS